MADAHIRRASMDDAETIAGLHVDAWRESYASLMPPEALSLLSVEEQAERWRDIFRSCQGDDAGAVFLALDEADSPLGFAACGRQRSPRLAEAGFPVEFSTLYLLRRAQGRGLGRAMMGVMAKHLIAAGYSRASGLGVSRLSAGVPFSRGARREKNRDRRRLDHFGRHARRYILRLPGYFEARGGAPAGHGIDVYGRRRKLPSLLAGRTRLGRSDHAGYRHNR